MKLFAAILAAVLTLISPAHAGAPGEVEVGGRLRDLPMQGLNGPPKKISAFAGKPLIINVWASWCPPCRAEMGSLERLSKRYGKQFQVIGISTDDYPEKALAFLMKAGVSFPMFVDQAPWPLEGMLGANKLPLTVVIDADGKVLGKYYGDRQWDSQESIDLIAKHLKRKL